jgi:5-methylcytosine-specific restriction endonuclease McrA
MEVFDACVEGLEVGLSNKVKGERAAIEMAFNGYKEAAKLHKLHTNAHCQHGKKDQKILGNVTKEDFVRLYDAGMVDSNCLGRTYYDRIKISAPLGKCPLCGIGHVTTLDHFLSKARYPIFSVCSANLVPCCGDCNKGKGSSIAREDTATLHPYFESKDIEDDVWLYAQVIKTLPVSIRYYVDPPPVWDDNLALRTENHFISLNLASRFSVEAATELATLREMLGEMQTADIRRQHLENVARIERRISANSWKAAFYHGVAQDLWYIDEGYKGAQLR